MSTTLAAFQRHQRRFRQVQRAADHLTAHVAPALEGVDPTDPDAVEEAVREVAARLDVDIIRDIPLPPNGGRLLRVARDRRPDPEEGVRVHLFLVPSQGPEPEGVTLSATAAVELLHALEDATRVRDMERIHTGVERAADALASRIVQARGVDHG